LTSQTSCLVDAAAAAVGTATDSKSHWLGTALRTKIGWSQTSSFAVCSGRIVCEISGTPDIT
jgi:hypothetical protein